MSVTFQEVVEAYYSCRKNKRNTFSQLDFEINLEQNLYKLYKDLKEDRYVISPSICFVVKQPRVREVWAAQFRDRVVHHIVYNRLSVYWNNRFEADSCACIPKRGTLYGAKRLHAHIRSESRNWTEDCYYLKCDLANFFTSIDKNVLWNVLDNHIEQDWLKKLTKQILFNTPIANGIYLSKPWEYALVEQRKNLGNFGIFKGLPIGNLTSQFFANIVMDLIDKFVKQILMAARYIRYVDDCIIVSRDKEFLKMCLRELKEKVKEIGMSFNTKKCFIHNIDRGVSFVGQTIYPHRRVPLKVTQDKCFKKVTQENLHCYIAFFRQSEKSYNICNKLTNKEIRWKM